LHIYDYIIVGAGVCGSVLAHELSDHTSNILLIDKNNDVASEASGAAGAFLSPLLGKPNQFKDLVNEALVYAKKFYNRFTPHNIINCGTLRIPKNIEDKKKFESYKPYIEFEYIQNEDGYFFPTACVVDGYEVCKELTKNIHKKLNTTIKRIEYKNGLWSLNDTIYTKKLILTTGYEISLLDIPYLSIRPVWGQRIDIKSSTNLDINYHKECSISCSIKKKDETIISIGATHHRFVEKKPLSVEDTQLLLKKATNIKSLENIEVLKEYGGARACSVDYFPIVSDIVNEKETLDNFPHLQHGSHIHPDKFSYFENIYLINGVGGRGFVLAPLLCKMLKDHLINGTRLEKSLKIDRFFARWVKKRKNS
jgi:glycine/D-amino acid oxidase-like deaminating enzyme